MSYVGEILKVLSGRIITELAFYGKIGLSSGLVPMLKTDTVGNRPLHDAGVYQILIGESRRLKKLIQYVF